MVRKTTKAKAKLVKVEVESKEIERLSSKEKRELKKCETVINQGWETFVEVGRALATIQKNRLYRAEHGTFEAYCRTRWQYAKSQAYRLIGAAEVVDRLSPIGDKSRLPKNEAQVRPLLGLEPKEQVKAWKSALESAGDGAVTAKSVRAAVASYQKPKRKASKPRNPLEKALKLVDEALEALTQKDTDSARSALEQLRSVLTK